MVTIADLKQAQRRPSTTVALCLNGALFSQQQRLRQELVAALADHGDSLAGNPQAAAIQDRIDALGEQMTAATFEFTFEALPRAEFTAIEDQFDLTVGQDYPPEYLRKVVAASLVDPDLTAAELDDFWTDLSAGQAAVLEAAALGVNRESGVNPFSSNGSAPIP